MPLTARKWRVAATALVGLAVQAPAAIAGTVINPPPQAKDWSALAGLPDWSGVWTPNMTEKARDHYYKSWKKAVQRSFSWVES